mmetsp:Transcript_6149/g.15253  ORF Transcript_6149/g.15253 Transcript_6149/m.15253 type:complete len:319 (-) Transcript_6149:1159-2115(-)
MFVPDFKNLGSRFIIQGCISLPSGSNNSRSCWSRHLLCRCAPGRHRRRYCHAGKSRAQSSPSSSHTCRDSQCVQQPHNCGEQRQRVRLVQRTQRHGNDIHQRGDAERHLGCCDRHDEVEARAGRRGQARVAAVCSPHSRDGGQRGNSQDSVIELHGGGVFEKVAPTLCLPLRPVLLGHHAAFHEREGVVGAACVHARHVSAAEGSHSDHDGHGVHGITHGPHCTHHFDSDAGVGSPCTRYDGGASVVGRMLDDGRRGEHHRERGPEHERVDGEGAREVGGQPVRAHPRRLPRTLRILHQAALHHPPTNHALHGPEAEE